MVFDKPPAIALSSTRIFLGFVNHNDSRYAVVRTTRKGPNVSTNHLEVIARVIRGGKSSSCIAANELAQFSAGEAALIHLPSEQGIAVSAWSIVPAGANLRFYRKHIYYVIEVLKPDEAVRVARQIISTQTLYRNDEAVLPVNFHNMHLPSVSKCL